MKRKRFFFMERGWERGGGKKKGEGGGREKEEGKEGSEIHVC